VADQQTQLNLHFELAEGVDELDTERIADAVQQQLQALEPVAEAEAATEETRLTGVEVAAGIAAAVLIVRSSRELVEELRKLIPAVRGLIADIRGLKGATVEVGNERVPIDHLTDEHLRRLASSPAT
jgi:hypothetical protein